jgi:hypothetical protein
MSHELKNIIDQVKSTRVQHGSFSGHIITDAQVRALEKLTVLDIGTPSDTDEPDADLTLQLSLLHAQRRRMVSKIAEAPKDKRSVLNETLQSIISQISSLKRQQAQLGSNE